MHGESMSTTEHEDGGSQTRRTEDDGCEMAGNGWRIDGGDEDGAWNTEGPMRMSWRVRCLNVTEDQYERSAEWWRMAVNVENTRFRDQNDPDPYTVTTHLPPTKARVSSGKTGSWIRL